MHSAAKQSKPKAALQMMLHSIHECRQRRIPRKESACE